MCVYREMLVSHKSCSTIVFTCAQYVKASGMFPENSIFCSQDHVWRTTMSYLLTGWVSLLLKTPSKSNYQQPTSCGIERGVLTLRHACFQENPASAICVQRFDDSQGLAIRITYRISLRSSSLWEPRHPLLKVVFLCDTVFTHYRSGLTIFYTWKSDSHSLAWRDSSGKCRKTSVYFTPFHQSIRQKYGIKKGRVSHC
jgi:hypothetical protein